MNLCDKCKVQETAGKYAKPHEDLKPMNESRSVKTMFGYIDEQEYKCLKCGHEWLHESGSYGCGWVK